jgi:hypothetical protein
MRRPAVVVAVVLAVLLVASCGGDDGGGSTVDDAQVARVAEDLGYTCDGPAGSGDEENRLCTDESGADALRTFVWGSSEDRDARIEFQQDAVCRAPDSFFTVLAVGDNWIAESLFDVAAVDESNTDEVQDDAVDRAEEVVDELGGEVQVLDHSDC